MFSQTFVFLCPGKNRRRLSTSSMSLQRRSQDIWSGGPAKTQVWAKSPVTRRKVRARKNFPDHNILNFRTITLHLDMFEAKPGTFIITLQLFS